MAQSPGLWIAIGGGRNADRIEGRIIEHDQFTRTVDYDEVRPRAVELVIVSLAGTGAHYVGISQAGRRPGTGEITLTLSNFHWLEALSSETIRQHLHRRFAGKFTPPTRGIYRPTPMLWEDIQRVIATVRPRSQEALKTLRSLSAAGGRSQQRIEGGLEVFERDAIASAIQVWGGRSFRKKVLRRAKPSGPDVAPFLSRLADSTVREDPLIGHDHVTFPGFRVIPSDVIGSHVLAHRGERLTILNCNRQPLEETLGVDLIYYNHRFDSFVLVQYKRMKKEDGKTLAYRPESDRNYAPELARMSAAEATLKVLPGGDSVDAFRLSGRPFFLKLCESKAKASLDAGMVSGMYIPLELWERLMKSPAVKGPRGGTVVTWDSCTRRLSNGEFTSLLRSGWIGSAAGQSAKLTEIIEQVLGSGRMLVLAVSSSGPDSRDYRRDGIGRFVEMNDPAGEF